MTQMRRVVIIMIMSMIVITAVHTVAAGLSEEEILEAQYNAVAEGLTDGNGESPNTASDVLDFNEGLVEIIGDAGKQTGGIIKTAIKSGVIIIVIAVLSSVVETIQESTSAGSNYVSLAGALAISAVAVGDVNAFMGLGGNTLNELNNFSKILLPTLSAAAAASGAVASSAAKYAATALFMDVLITVSQGVLMPVINAYIASVIAEAAIGGDGLSGASNFLKWLSTSLLTMIVLGFIVYLSVTGVVTSTADAATLRVAKTTLSTTLPVVGSMISDAASSVLAGASVLKNTVGVFGMLAIIGISIIPFLQLGAHYLMYKVASKLTIAVAGSRISKLVNGIGNAFGLVMGLTGACTLMIFFSIISMIKAVSPG